MLRVLLLLIGLIITSQATAEQSAAASADPVGIATQVQDLKKAVLELNRDLFLLEEELLFPGHTQVAVFLSMDVGAYFRLDAVELKVDDKSINNHLYTAREEDALKRGGVQRLYLGNLKTGRHELVAFFTGIGPEGREYRRGTTITFEKGISPKFLELKIQDSEAKQQPSFSVKEWE